MLFPSQRLIAALAVLCAASACSSVKTTVENRVRPCETVCDREASGEPRNAVLRHDEALGRVLAYAYEGTEREREVREAAFVIAVAQSVETVKRRTSIEGQRAPVAIGEPPVSTSSTGSVMACIRAHESGDYSEHSHPGSGSGAYQYTPATFRTWFVRWGTATGYSGPSYSYAYQAPPSVQDAVTAYTLTHGGAGAWSVRFGPDPCTGN